MTFDEPTYIEKLAYMRADDDIKASMSFLAQFEGTPLAPQAIALAEQELAQDQRRLQKQMVRDAQRQTEDTSSDWTESEGIRLQKQQLQLELYKMKAMTPAPQPGDAEIGTPDPAAQMVQQAQAQDMQGTELGAPTPMPEQAPAPKLASHPLDMPGMGARWDNKAYEDYLMHGDDPRIPAAARKAILQHHISQVLNAPVHTPEAALAEAKSHGRAVGGGLGGLGGLGLGGLIGSMAGHTGAGLAIGGVGGGLLGGYMGGKALGTPDRANRHIEEAKGFQAAMQGLHNNDAGQERVLSDALADRLRGLEHDEGYGRKKAALEQAAIAKVASSLVHRGKVTKGKTPGAGETIGDLITRLAGSGAPASGV